MRLLDLTNYVRSSLSYYILALFEHTDIHTFSLALFKSLSHLMCEKFIPSSLNSTMLASVAL